MPSPVLSSPALLGTTCGLRIRSLEQLQGLLELQYTIDDLEPLGSPREAPKPLTIEAAVAVVGEVRLVSVLGSPVTLAVNPVTPFCSLALPSHGWGRYQMDGHAIDNTVGHTVAFLPACAWRLTNDHTGGTAVQFTEESLLERMVAMAGNRDLPWMTAQLSRPVAISTQPAPARRFYHHLLAALAMVDSSYRLGLGEPDPMLRLDDLILRCVACLLFPQLSGRDTPAQPQLPPRDIPSTVQSLMEWMSANQHQPISLSEIESRCHYGRRAIQMGFKAEVGCGPMQWLRRQRLQSAYRSLRNPTPDCTVTAVAHACGYLNLSSFSRDFRERFGISASELMRQARLAA